MWEIKGIGECDPLWSRKSARASAAASSVGEEAAMALFVRGARGESVLHSLCSEVADTGDRYCGGKTELFSTASSSSEEERGSVG